jgi:hypothetical protein
MEQVYEKLEGIAQHLIQECAKWTPVDRAVPHEQQRISQAAQDELLRYVALAGGGAILHLAAQKQLDSLPRLQTRALQTRSELRRHVDTGELPLIWRPYRGGFDGMMAQLFDDCCRMWLAPEYRDTRFGDSCEVLKARLYVRFLTELAAHLRGLPPDPRTQEEQDTTDYVRDHNALRVLWEQLMRDGDSTQLLRFVREHPGVTTTSGQQYPYLHRICDVILEGHSYRLLRHAHWTQYLILKPIPREIAFPQRPGVPYWLQGEQLRRWVQDVKSGEVPEMNNPAYWDRYK